MHTLVPKLPYQKCGEVYRAGLPMLGARLLTAAKMVRKGGTAADIGCDHGKLAVWLALTGACSKVVAIDKRPLPLARAEALAKRVGANSVISCRLGDGLAAVRVGEVQDIVLAGLSGETIIKIVQSAPWVFSAGVRLMLVPATRHAVLRKWLCAQGFALLQDVPVEENKKFYAVMQAEYTGEMAEKSTLFYELGHTPSTPGRAAAGYAAKCMERLQKQAKAPSEAAEELLLKQLINEVGVIIASLQQAET